jgi:PAS domain S-box-containing protein
MPERTPPTARHYAAAVLSVVAAAAVRLLLNPILGEREPFATFLVAIIFTAWYGGLGPSMLAFILGTSAAVFLFTPPQGYLVVQHAADWVGMVVFAIVGLTSLLFCESLRAAQQNAHALAREALDRQQQLEHEMAQRRRAEEAQSRLAALVESSEDAIVAKGLDGRIESWNAGAERLYGYTAEEAIGQPISMLIPPGKPNELPEILERIRRGQRNDPYETVRQTKDGRLVDVSVSISPVFDHDGQLVQAAAIARDITDQKRQERRRNARLAVTQALNQAASLSEAAPRILQAICQSLPWNIGLLWILDRERYVLCCQEVWRISEELTGFAAISQQLELAPGQSLPGRTWACRAPVWVPDVVADEQFVRGQAAASEGLHGGFACPIQVGSEFLGVIEFFSDRIREPDADLLEMMSTMGSQIGQFIERKRSEAQLRRSEQDLADFFDHAVVGLHWLAADGTILRTNQAELDMLGYTVDEYVGRQIADFHVDKQILEDVIRRLQAGESVHDCEARLRCKDGSIKHVLIDSNVLWENGKFVHTRSFTRDITDRKRAEQALRFLADASTALAEQVDYESTLQKVARLAVPFFADWCVVDLLEFDGSLRRLAVAHHDPSKAEWIVQMAQRYPPDPQAAYGSASVVRSGRSLLEAEVNDELLVAAARDQDHLQLLRALGLASYICVPLAARGRILGAISFATAGSGRRYRQADLALAEDLARRAAVAIENAGLYRELRDADRRKDEFLAMLAHELRNPLAPIRNALDLMSMEQADEETVRWSREIMRRQVEHMVRLVDDLLDVSRIMRGKIELRKEPVELAAVVQRAVETARPVIDAQRHQLQVVLPQQPVWLEADPIRLAQVLSNLLNNAAKYTEQGGHIWLSAERDDGHVRFRVRDDGMGIAPEMIPHLFELFTQADQSLDRAQGGLGIGLSLVQNLVQMHGGTVTASSQGPGTGSEFVVELPAWTGSTSPPPAESGLDPGGRSDGLAPAAVRSHGARLRTGTGPAAAPRSAQPAEVRLGAAAHEPHQNGPSQRRILVVDDSVSSAHVLAAILARLGSHEVRMAHDGESALAVAHAFQPEVVLLDIGLPGVTGYEVARRLRNDPAFNETLLVALTGYGAEEDRRRSMEAGFDVHLVKPAAADTLQELLSHRRAAKASAK